jgi:superfamily II DNA/RNA helicase
VGALRCLVLDEADRMLEAGLHKALKAIARRCPVDRQTLLFSATWGRVRLSCPARAPAAPHRCKAV